MKNTIGILTLLAVAFAVGAIMSHNIHYDKEANLYPQTATVVNIENDKVIIEDFSGFLWSFEGAEDWEVNDVCALIMDSCGTKDILDDKIVSVKYCGWVSK